MTSTTVKLKDVEPFTEAELFQYAKLYHSSQNNNAAQSTGDVDVMWPEDYPEDDIARLFATALKGCSDVRFCFPISEETAAKILREINGAGDKLPKDDEPGPVLAEDADPLD